MAQAVHRRRIDPVDAALYASLDGGDRIRVILWASAELAIAADGPGPQPNG